MLSKLWRSLGKGARGTARSIKNPSGPVKAALVVGKLALPTKGLGGLTGKNLRGVLKAGTVAAVVAPRVSRAAARVFRSASASFRRRAMMVGAGTYASVRALGRVVSVRGGSSSALKTAAEQADKIVAILKEKGVTPDKIGVDGLPGSGKSTLARALAGRLGMKRQSLDYKDLHLAENVEAGGTVYEHHRLLRTQDVDIFDAIVYIDMSVGRCRARVCRRGRGLFLAIVLNYRKLRKIGKLAFEVCEGEPIAIPFSPLLLKIKPSGGFRALENTVSRLEAARPTGKGSKALDTSGMSREEMLFLLASGKRKHGLKAYLKPLDYISRVGKLAAAVHSAGRGFMRAWHAKGSAVRRAR
jgi:hypothetical protein